MNVASQIARGLAHLLGIAGTHGVQEHGQVGGKSTRQLGGERGGRNSR